MTLETLLIIIGFIFGAVCGSFFNVVICRLPLGESIAMPPSHCRQCGEPIQWYDNIPMISYIVLGGRCRACKTPYSFRYFVVELLTAVLFALVVSKYVEVTTRGSVWKGVGLTLFHFFFVGGMIVSAFTDLDHQIIPNEITYTGIPLGLVASFLFPKMMFPGTTLLPAAHWKSLLHSFLASVGAGGFLLVIAIVVKRMIRPHVIASPMAGTFYAAASPDSGPGVSVGQEVEGDEIVATVKAKKVLKQIPAEFYGRVSKILVSHGEHVESGQPLMHIRKEALGWGDVKLLAVIGAFLGWQLALLTVFLSSVVGLLGHVVLVTVKRSDWRAAIPFGVYIAPASLISYFWGHDMIRWYVTTMIR